jgi:hypothetical protein
MADPSPQPQPQKPTLTTHPLVTKLLGDSDTPPDVVTLVGYFGPSKRANYIRLYPSLDFHSYFEIPRSAIVATTSADPKDESGPTVVHVTSGTKVDAVQTTTQPVEAYLQGGITGGYLAGATPTAAAVPATGSNCTICTVCTQIGCPISAAPCSGVQTQCCPVAAAVAVSAPPCSGIHTQCCAVSVPPCSGVQTQCCAISAPPCSGVQTQCCAAAAAIPHTPATVCTQVGCPSHLVICHTAVTLCTQIGCPTHVTICHTPATVCTQIGCPTHAVVCPTLGACGPLPEAAAAVPNTLATVCTQIGCPSQAVICNTHFTFCHTSPVICNFTPACPTRPIPCQASHLVICPTPSIVVAHCPVNTLLCPITPNCPTRICPSVAICPTLGICPSIACTLPVGGGGLQ